MNNFEINMAFTLYLPDEINFTEDNPVCKGLVGTDIDVLRCTVDRDAKSLLFDNAMQYK